MGRAILTFESIIGFPDYFKIIKKYVKYPTLSPLETLFRRWDCKEPRYFTQSVCKALGYISDDKLMDVSRNDTSDQGRMPM